MGNFIAKVSGSREDSLEMFSQGGFLAGEVVFLPRGLCLPGGMASQPEPGLSSQDGEQSHLRESKLPPDPALVPSIGTSGGT